MISSRHFSRYQDGSVGSDIEWAAQRVYEILFPLMDWPPRVRTWIDSLGCAGEDFLQQLSSPAINSGSFRSSFPLLLDKHDQSSFSSLVVISSNWRKFNSERSQLMQWSSSFQSNLIYGWKLSSYKTFTDSLLTVISLQAGIFNYDEVSAYRLENLCHTEIVCEHHRQMRYVHLNLILS